MQKGGGIILDKFTSRRRSSKGVAGVDNVTVDELDAYFIKIWNRIKGEIISKKYKPQSVRRVYIPKANGGKRPL